MKVTKSRLKEIIKEELGSMDEAVSPLDFSQGRDPSIKMSSGGSGFPRLDMSATPESPAYEHFVTLKSLYGVASDDMADDENYRAFLSNVATAAYHLVEYMVKTDEAN